MARLIPKQSVVKRLLALSGNQCAFPDCLNPLVFEGVFVGHLAHIVAAEPGGPRYDINMDDEQRRSFDNLLFLCAHHHTIIDKKELSDKYTVSFLRDIKKKHESAHEESAGLDVTDEILDQVLDQINIIQANVLYNGTQNNIQQTFITQSAHDASSALSQAVASMQKEEGEESPVPAEEEDEGFLDMMAEAEATLPLWSRTIEEMSAEIDKIKSIMDSGVEEMHKSDRLAKGLSGRIAVLRSVASNLDPISRQISLLGDSYKERFAIVDKGIKAILNIAEEDNDKIEELKDFLQIMLGLVESANQGFTPVDDMLTQMKPLEVMSMDMKRTFKKMRHGLSAIVDSRSNIENWGIRIEALLATQR